MNQQPKRQLSAIVLSRLQGCVFFWCVFFTPEMLSALTWISSPIILA